MRTAGLRLLVVGWGWAGVLPGQRSSVHIRRHTSVFGRVWASNSALGLAKAKAHALLASTGPPKKSAGRVSLLCFPICLGSMLV